MSQLPFFYSSELNATHKSIELDETNSKHIVQVLRMQEGGDIRLTNGKGLLATASISMAHKKHAQVGIKATENIPAASVRTTIAISPLKNNSRFEWFLEKATELGISEIYPLLCTRTERAVFKHERFNAICISAMLQSQQTWLPVLQQPIAFNELVAEDIQASKWIAHCLETERLDLKDALSKDDQHRMILIGPEGDFTPEEIEQALGKGYKAVTLGSNRLRTETAGVVAATILRLF